MNKCKNYHTVLLYFAFDIMKFEIIKKVTNLEVYLFFLFISETVTISVNTSAVFTIKWPKKWVGLDFCFWKCTKMHIPVLALPYILCS